MTKKILAALLAVMMLVSLLPATFAVNAGCPGANVEHNLLNCPNAVKEGEPVAPGCCTPGYQLYVCECGEHFAGDIKLATEADDCTWKLESAYVAPDCVNDGAWAKYVCEVGGINTKLTDADGVTVAAGTAAPEALDHDFGAIADCHDGKTCQREGCGYTTAQGKHSWEESFNYEDIRIDLEPSELQNGEFHYVCSDCGAESEPFVIVFDDHVMTKVQASTATCSTPGLREHYTCANACCEGKYYILLSTGKYQEVTYNQLIIDTVAHTYKQPTDADYDAWVTQIDPTCKTNGYTYKKCTVCNEWIEDSESFVPAGPDYHSWTILEAAVTGNCLLAGKTELKACSVCRTVVGGDVVPGTGEGHAEQTVTFAGNCMKEAYAFTYCTNSFCTAALETSLTLGATTVDLTQIAADGVKILDSEVGQKNADVHNIGWYTTEEATCKAGGHKVELCLDCGGAATGRYEEIAPSEDYCKFGTNPVTPATCTEQAVYKCEYCDREEARGNALGHSYEGQPTLTVNAHCTGTSGAGVDGYTYQECVRHADCGEINKTSVVPYEVDYIYEDAALARAQHTLPADFKAVYVQGDCTRQGLWTLGECSDCGRVVLLVDETTGNGHTEQEGTRRNPTCTAAGGYTCANTHCSLTNKWVVEAALGHTLVKVDGKEADCENDGNKEHYKCARAICGVIMTASADLTISDDGLTLTMPLLNVLPEMWVVSALNCTVANDTANTTLTITDATVDGTYTLVASKEYTIIVKDGKFVAALEETTASMVINKLGHHTAPGSLGFTDSTLNPATNSNAYENNCVDFYFSNVMWCARCAYSVMEGYKAETDHDISDDEEDLIFDDCEEDGYYLCGNGCGHTVTAEGTATGHKNSDGDYFWSGCEDTEDNRHCVVCCADPDNCTGVAGDCLIGNEHDYLVVITNASPTCYEYGYNLKVCKICGYEHIEVTAEKLQHNMVWNDYTEDGKIKGVCTMCGFVDYKTGISFELGIDNANHAGADYTQSSLIEVTINLCATVPETALRGFNLRLNYSGVLYVGYEYVSEDFDIYSVTSPENALNNDYLLITGMASNDRLGNKQNVAVSGKNAVIKLYFRVMSDTAVSFEIPSVHEGDSYSESAWVYEYNADADDMIEAYTFGDTASAYVLRYMDITEDGAVTMTDVLEAYEMIANPNAGEDVYDVVMDVDKDGEVTLFDLQAIMEYKVGNADFQDMFELGISDEELALIAQIRI